ncbi:unnamed protein product [Staurois parvus]|uniref:Uncharacterized protein n=1 Tax=Staurois parvus TaxID=386267 RepID=A0ABN9HLJ2_9NEOB|nr:unnamed protein product [Staurois parvus]
MPPRHSMPMPPAVGLYPHISSIVPHGLCMARRRAVRTPPCRLMYISTSRCRPELYLDGCVLIKIVSGPFRYRLTLFNLGDACTDN